MSRIHQELAEAASGNRVVMLDYKKDDADKAKVYMVEPYSYRGDKLFAYDRMAKSIKAFNLLNIVRVRQTQVKFKPQWPVEIGQEKS